MTFREKLAKEQGRNVEIECPFDFGYEKKRDCSNMSCTDCWDREIPTEKTYEEGLQDAWELAKKILYGNDKQIIEIFDIKTEPKFFDLTHKRNIINCYTPQEALAKLKAYEEEIKVGDVVRLNNSKYTYVVTVIYEERGLTYYCGIAESGRWFAQSDVTKTGKHIDIESLLGQIRGE